MLTPYADEIIGYHLCGFWHNINDQSNFLYLADTGEKMGV
jgi:hypothetical protein